MERFQEAFDEAISLVFSRRHSQLHHLRFPGGYRGFFRRPLAQSQGPADCSPHWRFSLWAGHFSCQLFCDKLWWLYLSYGVISGIGLGFGYIVSVAVLVKWFPDRRGLIAGVAVGGFGTIPAFAADYFGSRNVGPIYGLMLTAWGAASAFGPLLIANLRQSSGGYAGGLHIIAGIMAVTILFPLPCLLRSRASEGLPRLDPSRGTIFPVPHFSQAEGWVSG